MHAVIEKLPVLEVIVPAGQLAQTFASVKIDDGAPARAYFPMGQVMVTEHAETDVLLIAEVVPAGQLVQDEAPNDE